MTYDNVVVGDFFADMVVQGLVIVENKAVQAIVAAYEVQLVNYLTATGVEIGLLFNFGAERLQIKRKFRVYRPKGISVGQDEQDEQDRLLES